MRALRVGEFADGGQVYGGSAYRDALATARADAVPIVYPRAGASWHDDDGVTLRFIGPSLPFLAHTGNDINDNSIAFVLEYRQFRMLFTGDAGVAAERRFLASGIDLRADVPLCVRNRSVSPICVGKSRLNRAKRRALLSRATSRSWTSYRWGLLLCSKRLRRGAGRGICDPMSPRKASAAGSTRSPASSRLFLAKNPTGAR